MDRDKLQHMSSSDLRQIRENAIKRNNVVFQTLCDELLEDRQLAEMKEAGQNVVEFHFVCEKGSNLDATDDGKFTTGNWHVNEVHCDSAVKIGAKLALHESSDARSYFQGSIIDWKKEPNAETGKDSVRFTVNPTNKTLKWAGEAGSEKGYKFG